MKIFLLLIGLVVIVCGYDTGHHGDLTRNGFEVLGYNRNAQKVGAVANWMVDYFSYTLGYEDIVELNSMHFDNLFYLVNISNYYNNLVRNTRSAVQNLTMGTNDPLQFLFILGSTLHAVQDFYTHSSWAQHFQTQCNCYRDETWFGELVKANGSITTLSTNLFELRTYSWGDECATFQRNCFPGQLTHGDYCEGINKDSYVRPFFEQSYGHAFAATVEWITNVERWVLEFGGNQAMIDAAKNYNDTSDNLDDLEDDYEASIEVSYATKTPFEEDGHYKGSGSGSIKRFATAAAEFMKTQSKYKKMYTESKFWTNIAYPPLYDVDPNIDQLNSPVVSFILPFNKMNMTFKKFKVRTYNVKTDQTIGTPSPFAIVFIDGLELEESVQIDKDDLNPHWTAIKFVPFSTTSVTVEYQLWNDHYPISDTRFDIVNDTDGNLNFVYNFATKSISGDATGSFLNKSNVFTTKKDDISVSIYVLDNTYGNCIFSGMPELFCPDEAYTDLKLHEGCDGLTGTDPDNNEESSSSSLSVCALVLVFMALLGL